ncbi:zinc finger protein 830-like [Rhodnius prolixus]|uniref:Zinc finger protein 830 n=1 Tax=Rhodnius prolixus TaxID=13249 RepID=T1I939_RHOPR
MSSSVKSGAKKISQHDLRKFMSAQKRKITENIKKIESPLAKYLENGSLTCIVCNSVVKSEAVWNVHINSKQHKENIAKRKQPPLLNKKPEPPAHITFKRPNDVSQQEKPAKKIKGILKNAPTCVPNGFFDTKEEEDEVVKVNMEVDSDELKGNGEQTEEDNPQESVGTSSELPEGFFDNPVLDAKARNVEYKDPVQEEWERFQREIKEETHLSARIIHDDTEDATTQRQIDEIDEQLRKLSRVVELDQQKAKVKAELLNKPKEIKEEEASSGDEDNDDDFEIEFDWRAKRYLC